MIRSKFFWLAAILLALIPLLVMDIPKHYEDWKHDVREEMITTVHNQYNLSKAEKANVLDHILDANNVLMAKMYLKSFLAAILLAVSVYFLARYYKQQKQPFIKAVGVAILLICITVSLKIYSWNITSGNTNVRLLQPTAADTTLQAIYSRHFKGKVVYVDFWGTTCGPCLQEFRNFTRPLKASYSNRKDIAYLYISGGNKLMWKQQLKQLDIEGWHIFLDDADYVSMYRQAVKGGANTLVYMPRYLIIDKAGNIADTDAPRPSDRKALTAKLDKYLAYHPSTY